MRALVWIEWLKLRKYRTFWVLIGLFFICFPGITYLVYYFMTQLPRQGRRLINADQYFQFPDIWQTAAYMGSFTLILLGMLVITLTTNEFVFRTHRQNIIDGWSRMQFIGAKWVMLLVFSLISTCCLILTVMVFGLLNTRHLYVPDIWENIRIVWFFFLQSLAYISVAFLFAMLFKRAGLAIGLFFLYAFILEKVVSVAINHFIGSYGRFLPLESTNHLIPNPLLRKIPGITNDQTNPYLYFGLALAYTCIFAYITVRHMRRSDL
jgi:ABC-2 type transport system permease protein